mmetsp:Transcript_11490/g.17106  ORF Transcript_11490/g.17106 Transcript_11490/m.17106 type:complete len:437 (-) Transcript_11490:43-1353(-)
MKAGISNAVMLIVLSILEQFNGDFVYDVCPEGSISDETMEFCCPESCGSCGGFGCYLRDSGENNCCTSQIMKSCDSSDPPCKSTIVGGCPNNGLLSPDAKFCCEESCSICLKNYLNYNWDDECNVNLIYELCSNGNLPCIIELEAGDCPSGGITDLTKTKCCDESCGQCGGAGCHLRPGGEEACCIKDVTTICSENNFPCSIDPVQTFNNAELYCSDGIAVTLGFSDDGSNTCGMSICCPSSCEQCNTSMDCDLSPECCAYNSLPNVFDRPYHAKSCRYNDPPCYIPPDDSPCNYDVCPGGAKCGEVYFFAAIEVQGSPSCYLYQECDCVENGNDAGQFCEILCDEGEIPCGEEVSYGHPYSSYGCCSSSDECYQTAYKWGPFSYCLWKDRPTTCDPDPCLNGAFCQDNGEYFSGLYSCICEEGFSGAYCEDEILD